MPGSVSAGIGAAGSIANGIMGSQNAAANGQIAQNAANQSNQMASNVYNTNQSNLNPYISTGSNAQSVLAGLLGTGGNAAQSAADFNNYKNSTNYNFQLSQGLQGVNTGDASAWNSGANEKALNNYAQGMAGNALNSYEGMLSGLGQSGLGAASTLGSLGSQYANQYAQNTFGGASGQIGANNQGLQALTGMTTGLTSGLSSGLSSYNNGSLFNTNPSSYSTTLPYDMVGLV